MRWFLQWLLTLLRLCLSSRSGLRNLALENLALRQQLAVLQRRNKRPPLRSKDRAFWNVLRKIWPRWRSACVLVKPETVIRWHRAGFRLFWKWKSSRGKPGRPAVNPELRALIHRMAVENPNWGAPRVHAELMKLGFHLSERSVQRWIPRRPLDPKRAQNWRNFLENHREVLAAMDFMVVPIWDFGLLHVLVILEHGRRIVRHVNVTAHPTAEWVKQQLCEAFPYDEIPRYLLFANDTIFGSVKAFIQTLGITPKQTGYHCPWQNGACERMIGTLRRDLFDHVIVLNEDHARRLLKDYLGYYHEDRTHLGLNKDSPCGRPMNPAPDDAAQVVALPRLGGLHHRYVWKRAA